MCQNLLSVSFAGSVLEIGEVTFYNTALSTPVFPNGIEKIGANAFYNRNTGSEHDPHSGWIFDENPIAVEVPSTVTELGYKALGNNVLSIKIQSPEISIKGRLFDAAEDEEKSTIYFLKNTYNEIVRLPNYPWGCYRKRTFVSYNYGTGVVVFM